MEPSKERLEYESDDEETKGTKEESRTAVLIKAIEKEGTDTPVQGMSCFSKRSLKARAKRSYHHRYFLFALFNSLNGKGHLTLNNVFLKNQCCECAAWPIQ